MTQGGLTIVTPIEPARLDEVDARLTRMGGEVAKKPVLPFDTLDRLHFASWVVWREDDVAPQIIFESNFDGDGRDFVQDLVRRARRGVDAIFDGCLGYPIGRSDDEVAAYLISRAVYTDTFYVGCVGLSRPQILREEQLRARIEDFLDTLPRAALTAADVRARIQRFVSAEPDLAWAKDPPDPSSLAERLPTNVGYALVIAAAVLALAALVWLFGWPALVALAALVAVFLGVLRVHEARDAAADAALPDADKVRQLVKREDHRAQNHLASVTRVKPGLFRRALLKSILAAIDAGARLLFNKGNLAGIPSIHFARWALLDRGRHLLFLSNFDGSWEHYLGEFIDQAAGGLTAVWSNAVGFPKTRWLFLDGAADEQKFKAYARESQNYTQLWYSAYPSLTVTNILNNKAIRAELWAPLDEPRLRAWLRRF
jgi:hypothetical protein